MATNQLIADALGGITLKQVMALDTGQTMALLSIAPVLGQMLRECRENPIFAQDKCIPTEQLCHAVKYGMIDTSKFSEIEIVMLKKFARTFDHG